MKILNWLSGDKRKKTLIREGKENAKSNSDQGNKGDTPSINGVEKKKENNEINSDSIL
jgi:hypothetical protein